MAKYEKYYGPEKARYLYREDLAATIQEKLKSPLKSLRLVSYDVEQNLRQLDRWELVPKEIVEDDRHKFTGKGIFLSKDLLVARNNADEYTKVVDGFKTLSNVRGGLNILIGFASELSGRMKKVTHFDSFIFEAEKALQEGASSAEDNLKAIREAKKDALDELKEIERATEKGVEAVIKLGLSNFGTVFRETSKRASTSAIISGVIAGGVFILAIIYLAYIAPCVSDKYSTLLTEESIKFKYADLMAYGEWLAMRIIPTFLSIWFIGHFLRQRNSFQHVAIANEHRANLCDAYVTSGEELSSTIKERFLIEALPHLARLGETGLIPGKSNTSDMPIIELLKIAIEQGKAKTV